MAVQSCAGGDHVSDVQVYLGDKAFPDEYIESLEVAVYDRRPIRVQVIHAEVDVTDQLDLPRQRDVEVSQELADVAVLLKAQNDAALDHLLVDHRHYLHDVWVAQLAVRRHLLLQVFYHSVIYTLSQKNCANIFFVRTL